MSNFTGGMVSDLIAVAIIFMFALFVISGFTKKSVTELFEDIKNWFINTGGEK